MKIFLVSLFLIAGCSTINDDLTIPLGDVTDTPSGCGDGIKRGVQC